MIIAYKNSNYYDFFKIENGKNIFLYNTYLHYIITVLKNF